MSEKSPDSLPQKMSGDYVHATVKAVLSAIPVGGGLVTELLELIIQPPLCKRRDVWLAGVHERLKALEAQRGLNLVSLSQNESFVSAVLQAIPAALRTHQEEKLEALRNAVLNVAVGSCVDDNEVTYFMRLVDELTALHIRVLTYLSNADVVLKEAASKHPNGLLSRGNHRLVPVVFVFPDYVGREGLYDQVCDDLMQRGLTEGNDLGVRSEPNTSHEPHADYIGGPSAQLSKLGCSFLSFLKEP